MKYDLIATDLDGTLLNSQHEISKENLRLLGEAKRQGKEVVFATGRILPSALYKFQKLDFHSFIIACNGAIIVDTKSARVLDMTPIDKTVAKEAIEVAKKHRIYYQFYTEDSIYVEKAELYGHALEIYREIREIFMAQGVKMVEVDNLSETIDRENLNILKFIYFSDNKRKLSEFRKDLENLKGARVVSSMKNNIELMAEGVGKGYGLERLCKSLNMPIEKTIGIGDNENDIDLIESAGLGVAMDNADPAIKEFADLVTSSNDDNGVGLIVQKYMLEG